MHKTTEALGTYSKYIQYYKYKKKKLFYLVIEVNNIKYNAKYF